MSVTVKLLEERDLPAVEEFSRRYWSRPTTEAYYRWRYVAPAAFERTFVALEGDRCVGTVSGLVKPFLVNGCRERCLEVFDWHCFPEYRGTGVGIRLMRAVLKEGLRVLSVGGTDDATRTLRAMGWQTLASARQFELPLSDERVAKGLVNRTGWPAAIARVPAGVLAKRWFAPVSRQRPFGGATAVRPRAGREVLSLYDNPPPYGLVQVADEQVLQWMTAEGGGAGSFGYLAFALEERLVGWSMTRVYQAPKGREAAIVEVFSPTPDVSLYTWMVSETAAVLAGLRPEVVRARATCAVLAEALAANHFRANADEEAVLTWPPGLSLEAGPVHITLNHADTPLRPYPVAGSVTSAPPG